MQDGKWQVLIVEDEYRIGMLIKHLIHWDEFNMECIDVVDNGETAYEIIMNSMPDVVITDIRMPKMNGLDLIGKVKEVNDGIKFIVISGYKEFEYAHKALQYGVNDYLLKPVNEIELNKVIDKIYTELTIKQQQVLEKKKIEKTVTESRQIIKRDFLKNIIEQEDEIQPDDARVPLEGEVYRGIDIKLDYTDYKKFDKKQDKLVVERIKETVERILKSNTEEVLICEKENLHIYCLFNYDYSKSKVIRNCINEILSEIKEYLIGFEQYEITIGVGTERTEFGEIRFSIKEAYRAAGNRIKLGSGRIIYTKSNEKKKQIEIKNIDEKDKVHFLSSIDSFRRENLEMCINRIYSDFVMREDLDFSYCYDIAEKLIRLFFEHIDMQQDESKNIRKRLGENCQHCYTILQLKELLKQGLGECLDAGREAMEAESVKPIRQACQYIDEHFGEKIVLEDIAEIVGLNPVYFSVLFKKETGSNFSAYLVNVRMEKAKDMICGTNETIAAIAEQVGYKDARYFSQVFTKAVGVKPALYRKLHS